MGASMNNKRRKKLQGAISFLNNASRIIDSVRDEEDDSMSNMPENLQETERFEKMENAVDALGDALDDISSAISSIESAME